MAYQPLPIVIGAYDVDFDDKITIGIRGPLKGRLSMFGETRQKLIENDHCHEETGDDLARVPCGLMIPKEAVSWSFWYNWL